MKLPVSQIAAIAKALDTDPTHLLRLTLREYMPDVLEAVENVLHRPLLTANEVAKSMPNMLPPLPFTADELAVIVENETLLLIQ